MTGKKLSLGILVLVVILLLGLTGCGGDKKQAVSEKDGVANEEKKIVLGIPTAMGSIEAADGVKAAQLAVDEINAAGGVTVGGVKYKIETSTIDTRENEPGIPINDSLAGLEKLVNEKKPNAIVVGAMRSELLLSSMDLLAKYKIPYIASIAMSPQFETKIAGNYEKYKYFFRTGMNSPYLVANLNKTMEFVGKKFNFKKVYFLYQDTPAWKGPVTKMADFAKTNGWTVVGVDAYPTGSSDFSTSLTKAKSGGAQLIVPLFDMPQSGILVKQAKAMSVPALIAGYMSPAAIGSAWTTFNGEIDGLVNFLFEVGSIPLKSVEKSVKFNEAYGKKYGDEALLKLASHGPGPAYDSIYVLVDAIKRANSLDPDALVAALEKTDTDGVVGKIKFNKDHQVVYGDNPKETASSIVFQWRQGKRLVVFPENSAETEIQLPEK